MRSPPAKTSLTLCLLASTLLACTPTPPQPYPSPTAAYSITIRHTQANATALFIGLHHRRTIFASLPAPGSITVAWLTPQLARITIPFGTATSATWFESPRVAIGPLPNVIATDAHQNRVAYTTGNTIRIAHLGTHLTPLATLPIPAWCPFLSCRYQTSLTRHEFTLQTPTHHTAIRLPPA